MSIIYLCIYDSTSFGTVVILYSSVLLLLYLLTYHGKMVPNVTKFGDMKGFSYKIHIHIRYVPFYLLQFFIHSVVLLQFLFTKILLRCKKKILQIILFVA